MRAPQRILYVDDDDDLRLCVAAILRRGGYEVDTEASAEAGLGRMRKRRYALVLTDQQMPGGTGSSMLQRAKREGLLDRTPACIFTSDVYVARFDWEHVLEKPMGGDALLRQVARLIASGAPDKRRASRALWASLVALAAVALAAVVTALPHGRPLAQPAG